MIHPQQVRSSAMHRWLGLLAAVAAVSVLAACGSDSSNTTPSATPGATAVGTATPTVAPPSTPTPTATPALPCKPGQFDITINNQQGAAGTIYATFEIRNTATSDCTENGYAHLQMLSSSGAKLADTWTNDNSLAAPGPVDLAPGTEPLGAVGATGHGYFLVWWTRRVSRGVGHIAEVLADHPSNLGVPDRRDRDGAERCVRRRLQGRPDQVRPLHLTGGQRQTPISQ